MASPSQLILLGDGFKVGHGIYVDAATMLRRGSGLRDYFGSTSRVLRRHAGKANVVFADGHEEAVSLRRLFEDTDDAALSEWNRDHLPHRELLEP